MTGNKGSSLVPTIAEDLRAIHRSDKQSAEAVIEAYLNNRLREYGLADKIAIVEELAQQFHFNAAIEPKQASLQGDVESAELGRLYSRLMGNSIKTSGALSSVEMNDRLSTAVNTVFDTVNRIISDIHNTLLGEKPELQTIRKIIGSQMEEESRHESLKAYLDQIQDAFLTAHEAFQEAARMKMAEVLNGLDPDRIVKTVDKGMKIGPLYKAELYEAYKARYGECRNWLDSGRFAQDLLREFERICQKKYKTKRRGPS